MIEKIFQSRIINKHDVEKNWNKVVNFIPKKGEFIIYDIDENYDYSRLKVGDGATVVGQLPFIDSDVRNSIAELTIRLNALADSDDTTLDQLSEIIAYIKSNKDLINAITTDKVSVEDIVDNLTTNATNKPLSAAQGMQLKKLVDAKVDKVEGKGLSSNDYTDTEKTKLAGIQEGAVSSWNDLEDKPFYEIPASNTVIVNSSTSGAEGTRKNIDGTSVYVKVSDLTPPKDGFIGGTLTMRAVINGEEIEGSEEITDNMMSYRFSDRMLSVQGYIVVIYSEGLHITSMDNFDEQANFPEKGIYVMKSMSGISVEMEITLPKVLIGEAVIHKIDKKYLPDDVGGGLPPVTEVDNGKVLTAKADGTAEWKKAESGLSVTEIESPDDINADSPDGFYIQEGGSSGGNGGGTTIHYYDSIDQVPADLPEGSFVAVPSEESAGGGGLPLVVFTEDFYSDADDYGEVSFTDTENAMLRDLYFAKTLFIGHFHLEGNEHILLFSLIDNRYSAICPNALLGDATIEWFEIYSNDDGESFIARYSSFNPH